MRARKGVYGSSIEWVEAELSQDRFPVRLSTSEKPLVGARAVLLTMSVYRESPV